MRRFYYQPPAGELIRSYELDMPAPAGLSGAPVVRIHRVRGAREVIGVVHASNGVATPPADGGPPHPLEPHP
jgi:hypothetical protein